MSNIVGLGSYNAYLDFPETKKEISQTVEFDEDGRRHYIFYENDLNCYILFFPKDDTKGFEVEKIPFTKEEFDELMNSE